MLQTMTTTKISKASNGQVRVMLPRALAKAVDIYDRENKHIRFEVQCTDRPDRAIEYVLTLILRNSVTVSIDGQTDKQPGFSATQPASELGVVDMLADGNVQLNWFERGARQLIGFVSDRGGVNDE